MSEHAAMLLLSWYDHHARKLPWRGIRNPYYTWVSETMLQQTRVETVIGYFARFLERFPTVASLAGADEQDVLKLWEGLGYYSRARNLHKGAKQVMTEYGGTLPSDVDRLKKISGIGPYTAGAIASIAYDQPVPAVDGNVIRVISRLKGVRGNVGIPSVRRQIEAEAAKMACCDRPGDLNQALMDLGARICVPGTPDCEHCPLNNLCDAYDAGDAEDLPELPRKNPPKRLEYDVLLILSGDRVLMRQRTETMLNGLWVYPMLEGWNEASDMAVKVRRQVHLDADQPVHAGQARHVFTHQVWEMQLYTMTVAADADVPAGYRFVSREEMLQLAIPTAVRAAKALAEKLLADT